MNKKVFFKYFTISLALIVSAMIISIKEQISYPKLEYAIATKLPKHPKKPLFTEIKNSKQKKQAFINYMLDAIEVANKEICTQQKQILKLKKSYTKHHNLNDKQYKTLNKYLKYYKINKTSDIQTQFRLLKLKARTVPTSFILAQAILESGWGTSRFAKDYNNYFGLHCFSNNCGVKANNANIYLETFENVNESVLGYYYRLNTGSKFRNFRITRQQIYKSHKSQKDLLDALENYSEIDGQEYKSRIVTVIRHNDLTMYDNTKYC